MKTLKLGFIIALTGLFGTQAAFADCTAAYQEKIGKLERFLIPSRGTVFGTSVSSAVTLPSLAAAGLLAPAAIISSAGAVAGLGAAYITLSSIENSYKNVLKLVRDANRGRGKQLNRLQKYLEKNTGTEIDSADVAKLVIEGFQSGAFCPYDDDSGSEKPLRFRKVEKKLIQELRDASHS